jgi:hypothetical protein
MGRSLRVLDGVYEIALSRAHAPSAVARADSPRVAGERVEVHGLEAARRIVTRLAAAGGTSSLRAILARGYGGTAVTRMTDAEVRDALARRIASGAARVYKAPAPRPFFRVDEPEKLEDKEPQGKIDEDYLVAFVEADGEPEMLEPAMDGEAEPEMLEPEAAGDAEPEKLEPEVMGDAEPELLEPAAEADAIRAEAGADASGEAGAAREANEEQAEEEDEEEEGDALAFEDPEAQAAALREAAASGAPFCEECERARGAAGAA